MKVKGLAVIATIFGMMMILSGCSKDNSLGGNQSVDSTFAASCEHLSGFVVAGGKVTESTYTLKKQGNPKDQLWPNHCLVRGVMNPRKGIDGKDYALQFELRLPEHWNQRLYYQGGSGVDGRLFTAVGRYAGGGNTRNALSDGFAVVTTDSGHITEQGAADGAFLFGADPQARDEYGDMQIPQITKAARKVLNAFYGQSDQYAYFVGCSNGGRQAMIAAQKYPDLFNGIIASSPGYRLAQASVQALYQAQLTAEVAPLKQDGTPDLTQGLSLKEIDIVKSRILKSCDALDGATDGIISRFSACHPDPKDWVCKQGTSNQCLTEQKADYVSKMFAGAHTSSGQQIYAPWPFDPGMALQFANPFLKIFAGEASHIYTTPPTLSEDLIGYALHADIDTEYNKMFATNDTFKRSGIEFTNGDSSDLDKFKALGGKLMILNGSADLAFSMQDVENYYAELEKRYGSAATRHFVKAYFIPGMGHCSGGNATDQFDSFTKLQSWVEQGEKPAEMIATAGEKTPWPGRTRPICPYPKEAVYNGKGDIESAESFHCTLP